MLFYHAQRIVETVETIMMKKTHNKVLHWTGIPLRSILASELGCWGSRDRR